MIAALVPAKALAQAKGRLSTILSDDERRRLCLAMLADVLRALQAVPQIKRTAVVSADADVLTEATGLRAEAIAEPPSVRGINAALTFAARELASRGADALLVIPMDLPTLTPAEVEGILDALASPRGLVLVPSAARGTSAIALRPPDAIPFRFGAQSFTAHRREATVRRVPARVLRIPSLAIDIDGPEDLLDLLSRPADTETHHTLAEMRMAERLRIPARRPA